MCRYCEPKPDGSWAGQVKHGREWHLSLRDKQKWLQVVDKHHNSYYVPIKYCPHCGRCVKDN